jgi:hypothetical protein
MSGSPTAILTRFVPIEPCDHLRARRAAPTCRSAFFCLWSATPRRTPLVGHGIAMRCRARRGLPFRDREFSSEISCLQSAMDVQIGFPLARIRELQRRGATMAETENTRVDLRDLGHSADAACDRIKQGIGVIARIYEAGADRGGWDEDGYSGLLSRRAVAVALAELAAEIPALTPHEAASAIALLLDENARDRGTADGVDWNARWLHALDEELDDQQRDLGGKVRLFALMAARHDARPGVTR